MVAQAAVETTLFVYGSLMVGRVLRTLLGREPVTTPATLYDYRRSSIIGASYPAIRHVPHIHTSAERPSVVGRLITDLSGREREIIDRFEDDSDDSYDIRQVVARTADGANVCASAYVWHDSGASRLAPHDGSCQAEGWSLSAFEQATSLEPFLVLCEGFVANGYWWEGQAPPFRSASDEQPTAAAGAAAPGAGGFAFGFDFGAAGGEEAGQGTAQLGGTFTGPVERFEAEEWRPDDAALARACDAALGGGGGGGSSDSGASPPASLVPGFGVEAVRMPASIPRLWKHVPPVHVAASLCAPPPAASAPSGCTPAAARALNELEQLDLVPGRYEGGFKAWECSVDLCAHLAEQFDALVGGRSGLRVVELGCGAALPSLLALELAARADARHGQRAPPTISTLWAQDYNRDVLERLTWPNMQLNGLAPLVAARTVRLLAGDWSDARHHLLETPRDPPLHAAGKRARDEGDGLRAQQYDLILSADTIYSPASIGPLWALIRDLLEPDAGVALVAAKSYYFGVGGSVAQLKAIVEADVTAAARGVRYTARTVAQFMDGKSNVREIVRIDATCVGAPAPPQPLC
jgi:gamma-glutamylcyclotransferase (GGCT)/AIG2-like uncharacterized protein YtfP